MLSTVMDMIFKYLPVERGLIILFDEDGNPVPQLTKFAEGAGRQDIPISRTILKMVAEQQISLMTSNALEDARLLGGKSIAMHGIRSAMCVPLWNRQHVIGAVQVDSPIHIGCFTEEDLDLLTALANFAAVAIERAQLAEKIEQEREDPLENGALPLAGASSTKSSRASSRPTRTRSRSAEISILFADISGFTTVSETKSPEEVAEFLSHFFSCAVESIFAYGGTLDKFIGDAVMAFFGAPIAQEDHADRAVLAGLMLQRLANEWNDQRVAAGRHFGEDPSRHQQRSRRRRQCRNREACRLHRHRQLREHRLTPRERRREARSGRDLEEHARQNDRQLQCRVARRVRAQGAEAENAGLFRSQPDGAAIEHRLAPRDVDALEAGTRAAARPGSPTHRKKPCCVALRLQRRAELSIVRSPFTED